MDLRRKNISVGNRMENGLGMMDQRHWIGEVIHQQDGWAGGVGSGGPGILKHPQLEEHMARTVTGQCGSWQTLHTLRCPGEARSPPPSSGETCQGSVTVRLSTGKIC